MESLSFSFIMIRNWVKFKEIGWISMQLSWISSVTNRYSVGIYTPKGVGEGKKPDLEGAQRGDRHGAGATKSWPSGQYALPCGWNITSMDVKLSFSGCILPCVGCESFNFFAFSFENRLCFWGNSCWFLPGMSSTHPSLLDLLWKLSILFEFHALLMISILLLIILSKLTNYICWSVLKWCMISLMNRR
jgi:hypothetical protein